MFNVNPNKILIIKIKELMLSPFNKYDSFLIKERKDNTYSDKNQAE
jgi:hypothetical protein